MFNYVESDYCVGNSQCRLAWSSSPKNEEQYAITKW